MWVVQLCVAVVTGNFEDRQFKERTKTLHPEFVAGITVRYVSEPRPSAKI